MEFVALGVVLLLIVLCVASINDQFTTSGYAIVGAEVATYLADCDVRLFVNNVTVTPNLVIGDLTQATFTGYTAQNLVTVAAPVGDPVNGGVSSFLPSHVFTCTTAPASPVTVYGWYLTDTGGALIAAGNLPEPITIDEIGDSVPIQVTLNYPG